jgi:diacylglycerol kinase (ATP)
MVYNMETYDIKIIANPTAGNGKAKKAALYVLQKIKSITPTSVNLVFTKTKNDATRIAREAISNGTTLIVAVGGDGTINEIVNGFFTNGKQINPVCELGIINGGTGGGYARTLNIPPSLDQQIELILKQSSLNLDVGSISYIDSTNKPCNRLFVNECQVGIGSKVASIVSKKYKIFGGTLAFGITATIQAIVLNPLKLNISYDNENAHEQNLMGLVVGNGLDCAGGMKLTPNAKLNDGFFDVLSMHEMPVLQRLLNLPKVYSGKHILSPYFSVKRCKKLTIESNQDVSIEADGEMLGNAPFHIEIIPNAIRVKAAY